MGLPAVAAWAFLPFAAPICLWVAWSDMKFMKIPNRAVIALVAVFFVVGPFALPLSAWAWQWANLAVVLVLGFLLNTAGAMGAGDAKFAAAAAPFVMLGDIVIVAYLLAATILAAFATHRGARAMPAVRRAVPDWESWTRRDFPMGLALGGTLLLYLLLVALMR
ncbi:prepilin peptidase CpaA [Tranquillimonas rosea]|uniref:Prepilin peptidase CpaA n=1 Tax=Tranquillimonas rosea TaxID=641238 RepID=A0A1H9UX33_9RHOB|nr:prepilin peptidase [Tranquillimonas rosea]SES13583.1 prepilin peptidase CpaA [Tranquillimonas rosea]